MQIIQVTDEYKSAWEDFVKQYAFDGGVLQSWAWGDFQKSLDRKIYRIALLEENGEIVAVALAILHVIHFDYSYLYCPRGPVVNYAKIKDLSPIFDELLNLSREERCFLIKVDPAWGLGQEKLLIEAGFRKADNEVQPKCNLIVGIDKPEEQLLAGMKQKTRYNINLAIKKGVKVHCSTEISDIETFWQLVKQTSQRDGISSHLKEYYKKMFEAFSQQGLAKLFLAEYQNKIIAANLVTFYGHTATYLHGASANLYREVMAPYLLQWEGMKLAKSSGQVQYDFGGVNGQTYRNDKWEGITRFKLGFSQDLPITEFIGTYEMVINPVVYSAYKFAKQIRG